MMGVTVELIGKVAMLGRVKRQILWHILSRLLTDACEVLVQTVQAQTVEMRADCEFWLSAFLFLPHEFLVQTVQLRWKDRDIDLPSGKVGEAGSLAGGSFVDGCI